MQLSAKELARLASLKGRNQILLYLAAHTRSQWWATTRELASIAGVPARRAELELVALVGEGWLDRKWSGNGNVSHFRVADRDQSDRGDPDQSDRGTAIKVIGVPRSDRSGSSSGLCARAPAPPDPDPSLDRRSMDQRVRPSGEVQEGTADGRTEVQGSSEVRGSDVQWLVALWGDGVSGAIARQMISRLFASGLSRREVRELLTEAKRGAHPAFAGLEKATFPLGAACSSERVERWRSSRARARALDVAELERPAATPVSAVSAREMEDFVRTRLRRR